MCVELHQSTSYTVNSRVSPGQALQLAKVSWPVLELYVPLGQGVHGYWLLSSLKVPLLHERHCLHAAPSQYSPFSAKT
jgi:hypothetical protein